MTHDELLKTIDSWQHSDSCALLMDDYCDCPFKALRAVVELTKPSEYDFTDAVYWKQTIIQAIEKELG